MIVIDASALVQLLVASKVGRRIATRITDDSLHAPHLLDVEATQAIRNLVQGGEISDERASIMLDALVQLDLSRYPHDSLLGRIWELRHNLSAYDATYVALGEALDCPLITCDARLARAPGLGLRIELFQ